MEEKSGGEGTGERKTEIFCPLAKLPAGLKVR